jgi:cellulose synthase/poly-beta-1,6-N-acetylglucosamine synthase-like glycosyltransferase
LSGRFVFSRQDFRAPLVVLTCCISLIYAMRSPETFAILFSALTKILQPYELTTHYALVALLRSQVELIQNTSVQVLTKSESTALGLRPRSFPSGMKPRFMLMVAATNVSVIVPTWNEERYLPKCLGSLVDQSVKEPFEIIVVDGGSEDRTVDIAREYADKVFVRRGQPVGAARNTGAKNARGKVLAFIDADTVASPRWLSEVAETFRREPVAVGVTGPTLPYEGSQLDRLVYTVATGWGQRVSLKLGLAHVAGFNCAYRKAAFWEAGGFDEHRDLSEDVLLSLKMRRLGRILFDPGMVAFTSLRRIEQCGYLYLTTYYLINAAAMLTLKRSLGYPKIR